MNLYKRFSIIFFLVVATQSYAIIGIGVHLVKTNTKISSELSATMPFIVERSGENLTALGIKLWLDFIPFIDLETTLNAYLNTGYNSGIKLSLPNSNVSDSNSQKLPYFGTDLDVTVVYPFFEFPPALSIIKIYVGGGLTVSFSTPLATNDIVQESAINIGFGNTQTIQNALTRTTSPITADQIISELSKGIKDQTKDIKTFKYGVHGIIGIKIKPPIIPITIYTNIKAYLISQRTVGLDRSPFLLEIGGSFTF